MTRNRWFGLLASLVAAMAVSTQAAAQQQQKPNILVIMGDDVGWFNIGAYHQGIMAGRTPNLDKLAFQKECGSPIIMRRRAALPGALTSSPAKSHCAPG